MLKLYISTLLILGSLSIAIAQSKIDNAVLNQFQEQQQVEFLVWMQAKADVSKAHQLKTKAAKAQYVFETLVQTAEQSQAPVIKLLEQEQVKYQSLYIVNVLKVEGDLALAQRIAALAEVKRIAPNPVVSFHQPIETIKSSVEQRNGVEWGITQINADAVWELGYRGEGIIVAGQDTGYDWEHPALQQQYKGNANNAIDHNYNWHDAIHELIDTTSANPCGLDTTEPCDDNRHGTHTMGTMIGEEGVNQIGVAPAAQWIGCRNMERGNGTPFTYLECFEWFLAPTNLQGENPDPNQAPHVIANSWGCPPSEGCNITNFNLLQVAIDNLKASGAVVVASAGNSGRQGCSTVDDPAAIFENSFTVGATERTDTIAAFSSRGPVLVDGSRRMKPNVSAPGVGVRSAVLNGNYQSLSGTSMAGPHVAGAVALIINANPALAGQVETIETILEQTARPIGAEENCGDVVDGVAPNNAYGFGRIDVLAAVQAAQQLSKVEDISSEKWVSIYPNPIQSFVTFKAAKPHQSDLRIYDMQGKLLLNNKWSTPTLELDISHLPAGAYFYVVQNGGGLESGKLVKM